MIVLSFYYMAKLDQVVDQNQLKHIWMGLHGDCKNCLKHGLDMWNLYREF